MYERVRATLRRRESPTVTGKQRVASHMLPKRPQMRLTDTSVAKLKLPPGKSDHFEWDDKLPGFGARIRSGGKRTWVVQYRFQGETRRDTLGSVAALGADQARSAAKITLAKLALGADPRAEK